MAEETASADDNSAAPSRSRRLTGLMLLAIVLCAAIVSITWPTEGPNARHWLWFGVLVGMNMVHTELARGVERRRRQVNPTTLINLSSVWVFAGVLLLPAPLAALVAAFAYTHLWLRVWRPAGTPPASSAMFAIFNFAITAGTTAFVAHLLGGFATSGEPWRLTTALVVFACLGAFNLMDVLLIGIIQYLRFGRQRLSTLLGSLNDNILELSTQCLGVIVAAIMFTSPWLIVLILVPVLVLHRAALVKDLEQKASTDEKTGLLNATSWRTAAEQAVTRDKGTDRHCGILMIDLDHFKLVNDTYGHVAGDLVLRSLAELLGDCTREHDLVGRFGGEEFAVLAARINQAEALRIAERIREEVKRMRVWVGADTVVTQLSASIGVATAPNAGTTVDELLERADQRLYLAKNGGRDRVVGLSEAS